jgi:hypothetical protein
VLLVIGSILTPVAGSAALTTFETGALDRVLTPCDARAGWQPLLADFDTDLVYLPVEMSPPMVWQGSRLGSSSNSVAKPAPTLRARTTSS